MEDWQQWQIQADEVAASLGQEIDSLEGELATEGTPNFRAFWTRFREMKEKVRLAPAIRLEDKLHLERRLRNVGNRAYKAQEALFAKSDERKQQLLQSILALRTQAEGADQPRRLRDLRRELDSVREQFDAGDALSPADRQTVWDAWREANQYIWQRLNERWGENEAYLREIIDNARAQLEAGQTGAARQSVAKFFESLRGREAKQATLNGMKSEAEAIRRQAEQTEERKESERMVTQQQRLVSPVAGWRAEVARNRDGIERLSIEVGEIERQMQDTDSILEQAMLRGNLVDKRRKLSELERVNRDLEQRIEQTEASPLIPTT